MRAPRDTALQHCLEYFGFQHPGLELGSARSVVLFEEILPELHQALRMPQSISMDRLAWWLPFPPRYTKSFVCLYTWPAASTLNVAVESDILLVRKHMISV